MLNSEYANNKIVSSDVSEGGVRGAAQSPPPPPPSILHSPPPRGAGADAEPAARRGVTVEETLAFLLAICDEEEAKTKQRLAAKGAGGGAILDKKGNSPRGGRPRRKDLGEDSATWDRLGEENDRELEIAYSIENKKIEREKARAADIARYPKEKQAVITKFYDAFEEHIAEKVQVFKNKEGRELLKEKAEVDVRHEVLSGVQKAIDNGLLSQQHMRSLAGCSRRPIPQKRQGDGEDDFLSIHAYPTMTPEGRIVYKHSVVGLQHCSSPLRCPVCSAKLAYVRREQVSKAVAKMAGEEGCTTFFLTLTAPHNKDTDIVDFVKKFREAKTHFGKCAEWKKFVEATGFRSQIVASEITLDAPWSTYKTGVHFHGHGVLFLSVTLDDEGIKIIRDNLAEGWSKACQSVGLVSPEKVSIHKKHGLYFEAARSTADVLEYIVEEVSFEISPPPLTKAGRREGDRLSQWQLMRLATTTHPELLPDLDRVMMALDGVRALFWSPGLRKFCGIQPIKKSKKSMQEQEPLDVLEVAPSSPIPLEQQEEWGNGSGENGESGENSVNVENAENAEIMKGEEGTKIIDITPCEWNMVCRYGAQHLLVRSFDILGAGVLLEEGEARGIIDKICQGINPLTGEVLRPLQSMQYTFREYRAAVSAPQLPAAA